MRSIDTLPNSKFNWQNEDSLTDDNCQITVMYLRDSPSYSFDWGSIYLMGYLAQHKKVVHDLLFLTLCVIHYDAVSQAVDFCLSNGQFYNCVIPFYLNTWIMSAI